MTFCPTTIKTRGTVNGKDAVIDFTNRTYVVLTQYHEVIETLGSGPFVINRHPSEVIVEVEFLKGDVVSVQRAGS